MHPIVEAIIIHVVSPWDRRRLLYEYWPLFSNVFKVGRTNFLLRRKYEWQRQCFPMVQIWTMYWEVPFAAKFEKLIHAHYTYIEPAWIMPTPCTFCGVRHQELFDLSVVVGLTELDRVVSHYCA
ncbi:hypothetical protein B0H10DRAFT_2128828 [Mycena sp. CBHHK59/15]|nr:hypothetical protein B0H10DRAFT_2128828 [Mycena sp. CBHHK59/15]